MSQLKDPKHIAKKRKYDHDLTHVKKFTSSVGHLLPVFYDLAQPGDKYDFRTEMFTQLTEMVSPAMTHVTEHVDWFFVPLKQISQIAPNNIFGIQDVHTTFMDYTTATTGNVLPMLDFAMVCRQISSLFSGGKTYQDLSPYNSTINYLRCVTVDEFGIPQFYNIDRLAQLLGYSSFVTKGTTGLSNSDVLLLSPLLACCYQKIWSDVYRLTDRIENNPWYYNLDNFTSLSQISTDQQETNRLFNHFFRLRYRPWKKDFFTNVKVSPLIDFGSVGMQPTSGSDTLASFNNWLGGMGARNQGNLTAATDDAVSPMQLSALRGAFAVEKLMEITRRAAKHYDSQVLAHFGFNVPEGIHDGVYRIGSESAVININEVIANSNGSATVGNDTLTTVLGEKGGRGSSYGAPRKKGLRFTAPCHGVIMALYSAVPECDYSGSRLDRLNTYRTRYDWWQPELDKLGMQPQFLYELAFDSNGFSNNRYLAILGYEYRYQELKTKPNQVYGGFLSTYKHWATVRHYDASALSANTLLQDYRYFYIDPTFLDNIMLTSFKPAATDVIQQYNAYARDPFLHWFKFYVHKASEISNYSLPDL